MTRRKPSFKGEPDAKQESQATTATRELEKEGEGDRQQDQTAKSPSYTDQPAIEIKLSTGAGSSGRIMWVITHLPPQIKGSNRPASQERDTTW